MRLLFITDSDTVCCDTIFYIIFRIIPEPETWFYNIILAGTKKKTEKFRNLDRDIFKTGEN